MSTSGANSDIFPLLPDPNPIINVGCPRSTGGLTFAVALCQAIEIEFEPLPLDCDPVLYGYCKKCSGSQIKIGIWKLPVTDVNGINANISFYIARGDGFLLLGNEIPHKFYQVGPEGLLKIPSGVLGMSDQELQLRKYFEPTSDADPETGRTYRLVVPSKFPSFNSFFSMSTSLMTHREKNLRIISNRTEHQLVSLHANCTRTLTSIHQTCR